MLIIHLKQKAMEQDVKIMVDFSLVMKLTQVTQILFNIVKEHPEVLSDKEIDSIQEVGDMLQECNKLFENAINMTNCAN